MPVSCKGLQDIMALYSHNYKKGGHREVEGFIQSQQPVRSVDTPVLGLCLSATTWAPQSSIWEEMPRKE